MEFSRQATESKKPLISIIVPIYNVKKYLRDCIQSICCQTYQNLEIILVDDGSTDGCREICDEYADKDKRVKVIHKANAGLGLARNSGMEIAQGEYFGFVDSDDTIRPQMYETLMECILRTGAEISACTREQVPEQAGVSAQVFDLEAKMAGVEVFTGHGATKELLQYHSVFKYAVWEKLYKRELFDSIKFRSVYAEGRDIMYKLLYACRKVAYIGLPFYCYRQRDGSTMLSGWNDHKDDMVYEQDKECFMYFKERNNMELYQAAVCWHFLGGIENYRRIHEENPKYKRRLKEQMVPYAKMSYLIKTDYPKRRKIEFWVFGHFPELHFKICNCVRWFKQRRKQK